MSDLREEVEALKTENAELRRRLEWLENPRLGPKRLSQEETNAKVKEIANRLIEGTKQDVPPVDRSNLCTTDGRPIADARASQTNATGQHPSYIVLCDAERAKGFVRPYRDRYQHVGARVRRCQEIQQHGTDENPHQCCEATGHEGMHAFDALMLLNEAIEYLPRRNGGCGTVTTMGRALSETYARDPKFYGATFCCGCNRHLPVAEFIWTADGLPVGS